MIRTQWIFLAVSFVVAIAVLYFTTQPCAPHDRSGPFIGGAIKIAGC